MKLIENNSQIEKLINNDPETLKLLYHTLFPKIAIYIKRNRGTYSEAEEVFQDALFQIIVKAKLSPIKITSSFEGYIFVVCKNLWLKELNNKKKLVRNDTVFELNTKDDDVIKNILHQERWVLFEEKLELLTDNCKALLKDFFNKVPYSVIVKKFKYSCENVAFQRVFKCKKKLGDLVKSDIRYKNLI